MIKIRRFYTATPPDKWRVSCRLCSGWSRNAISLKGAFRWAEVHINQHQAESLDRERT